MVWASLAPCILHDGPPTVSADSRIACLRWLQCGFSAHEEKISCAFLEKILHLIMKRAALN